MHAAQELKRELSDPADALERIDEVLRLSRSAIWEVDRDGVYTYASASHETLLGYRPEELVGMRTIHDFYPREVPAELQRELSEDWIGAGEEFTDLELPLVAKSGEIVWVMSHGKPIFGAEGRSSDSVARTWTSRRGNGPRPKDAAQQRADACGGAGGGPGVLGV